MRMELNPSISSPQKRTKSKDRFRDIYKRHSRTCLEIFLPRSDLTPTPYKNSGNQNSGNQNSGKQLAECAGNDNSTQSRSGLLKTLALLYGATQGLERPQDLLPASVDQQKRKLLKPQTMLKYLAAFSNLVDYCFLFELSGDRRREYVIMNREIKNTRKASSTAAIKSYRFVAQEIRPKVPTRSLVC